MVLIVEEIVLGFSQLFSIKHFLKSETTVSTWVTMDFREENFSHGPIQRLRRKLRDPIARRISCFAEIDFYRAIDHG